MSSSKETTLLKPSIEGVVAVVSLESQRTGEKEGDENPVIEIMCENDPNLGKSMGKYNRHSFSFESFQIKFDI